MGDTLTPNVTSLGVSFYFMFVQVILKVPSYIKSVDLILDAFMFPHPLDSPCYLLDASLDNLKLLSTVKSQYELIKKLNHNSVWGLHIGCDTMLTSSDVAHQTKFIKFVIDMGEKQNNQMAPMTPHNLAIHV